MCAGHTWIDVHMCMYTICVQLACRNMYTCINLCVYVDTVNYLRVTYIIIINYILNILILI